MEIIKNANKIMWVEYWINHVNSNDEAEIWADKYDDYRWECIIELPLINQKVSSIASSQINAMINASKKANDLIKKYMDIHPELVIRNMFKGKQWQIVGDESGNFKSMGMSPKMRKAKGKQMQLITEKSIEAVVGAIKKIEKINGTSKNLFIQVLDQSLFDENKPIDKVMSEVADKIEKDYNVSSYTVNYMKNGNSIIVVGYTALKDLPSFIDFEEGAKA